MKLASPKRRYKFPLVRAHEGRSANGREEELAVSKFQVTRGQYPRQGRGAKLRTKEVPGDVRASVHAMADADGLLCGGVDPHAHLPG